MKRILTGGKWYSQGAAYKLMILDRDAHECQVCGCAIGEVCNLHYAPVGQLDVAHIIPYEDGGLSTPDNQRCVCHPCNVRERYRTERQPVFDQV
ncbi:MAG: HNH endonuclease [Chloroflexi bacterium]|nr:HNH endonuclease [Chloroflexota bacterium]